MQSTFTIGHSSKLSLGAPIIGNPNLQLLLDSGQCFRYYKTTESTPTKREYLVCSGNNAAIVSQTITSEDARYTGGKGCCPIVVNCPVDQTAFWEHYFHFDSEQFENMMQTVQEAVDYGAIPEKAGAAIQDILSIGQHIGLFILNQDWWETIVSFTLSSNNNIARIKSMVSYLCEQAGDTEDILGIKYYKMPTPDAIMDILDREGDALRLGYRLKYLYSVCHQAKRDHWSFELLSAMSFRDAMNTLTGVRGIGPKVASCICLFGLGFGEAFPVDVWITRGLDYLTRFGICASDIQDLFGKHSGLFQQCMYIAISGRLGVFKDFT